VFSGVEDEVSGLTDARTLPRQRGLFLLLLLSATPKDVIMRRVYYTSDQANKLNQPINARR